MELFIRIKNGQPFEHPIFGDNFRQAFPHVNVDELPEWVARFTRVPQPDVGVYEVYEGSSYGWQNDVVADVHHIRAMTSEEIAFEQQRVKSYWEKSGYPSWVFDEATCAFKPPVIYPEDGKNYQWDEPTTSWVEII
jgi:hypothetical protein